MNEIIRLKNSNEAIVKKYIQDHYWDLFYLSINIYNSGLIKDRWNRNSGDYYGFYGDNQLQGLFSFANNKIMHVHYKNHQILKKIDYFRALNKYQPKIIKGPEAILKETYQLIEHKVQRYQLKNYYIMALKTPVDTSVATIHGKLTSELLNNSIDFLVRVEKTFGRNPKLVNQLKERVLNKYEKNEFLFIAKDHQMIAQGSIERRNEQHCLISGIYTDQRYRKQGFAEEITLGLCQIIQSRGLTPVLLVNQKNTKAIQLYEKIGFENVSEFSIMEIELR